MRLVLFFLLSAVAASSVSCSRDQPGAPKGRFQRRKLWLSFALPTGERSRWPILLTGRSTQPSAKEPNREPTSASMEMPYFRISRCSSSSSALLNIDTVIGNA
jgi:hypothetical protein